MMKLGGLTGFLSGGALAALGFAASVVIAPPAPQPAPMEQTAPDAPETAPSAPPENVSAPSADPIPDAVEQPMARDSAPQAVETPQPEAVPPSSPESTPEEPAEAQPSPPEPEAAPDLPESTTPQPSVPLADMPDPDSSAALAELAPPTLPGPVLRNTPTGLPGTPQPPRDRPLPQSPAPPAPSMEQDPEPAPTATPEQDPDPEQNAPELAEPDAPRLPGTRVTGLPGQTATTPQPASDALPEPETSTALERNSSFTGPLTGAPLMAVVLNDPGLPTPLRRSLAALELPVTIALNPMDPSAEQAAEIYREAGKEVLILATGLPSGARATDLDVTFGAWFDTLPQAVGVLDLPRGGFARNTSLTAGVLPLIARDGHGLLSFSGGLSRVSSAAAREGVPHAEVFRVLDDEDQSPFTIRRYLDRAVFQASQIGEVIVFGDATNDATMEALELWRSAGRADQVAVVPVSAILLTR